jgi:hypothetical protein
MQLQDIQDRILASNRTYRKVTDFLEKKIIDKDIAVPDKKKSKKLSLSVASSIKIEQ